MRAINSRLYTEREVEAQEAMIMMTIQALVAENQRVLLGRRRPPTNRRTLHQPLLTVIRSYVMMARSMLYSIPKKELPTFSKVRLTSYLNFQ